MDLKSKNKFPPSASCLYFKLYCERNKKTLAEAAKSWLSLSETEKHQFYTKYKEGKKKQHEKFVNSLKKAEPFLKEKDPGKSPPLITTSEDQATTNKVCDTRMNSSVCLGIDIQESENNDTSAPFSINEEFSKMDDLETLPPDMLESHKSPTNTHHETTIFSLCEPLPPSLKTGKDLYEMVKLMNDDMHDSWKSLSYRDKYNYNRAVLRLKRDYLKKYREYLESLSPRELFDYYNKSFD